jgi:hypothetical protein
MRGHAHGHRESRVRMIAILAGRCHRRRHAWLVSNSRAETAPFAETFGIWDRHRPDIRPSIEQPREEERSAPKLLNKYSCTTHLNECDGERFGSVFLSSRLCDVWGITLTLITVASTWFETAATSARCDGVIASSGQSGRPVTTKVILLN